MTGFIVTGTGTDVGKSVFSAALACAVGATYWKPIQSGLASRTDTDLVRSLGVDRYLPEAYRLTQPLSPHRAAEIDGVEIDLARLSLPGCRGPIVVEGAGGVLVPVTRNCLFADLFAVWSLPVVLVAGTELGTINHTLLSIEALRSRDIVIHGVAFVGKANEDNEATIAEIGAVKRLGRLPWIDPLRKVEISSAFDQTFRIADFPC